MNSTDFLAQKRKARRIAKTLDALFPNPEIPLKHSNIFTLLVAVLLSAQCRDERVNRVTPELFKLADNPEKMSQLQAAKIRSIIKPCGLSEQKSKAIRNLSQILCDKYHGRVPDTLEDLKSLPGVGHKTASVVLIQGFNKIAFPVDTHIHRLAKRWGLSSGKNVTQTEKDLKNLFPEKNWSKIHLQIIYYGRTYCPAKAHKKSNCPICQFAAVDH